jgi:hypothetical protein
MKIRKLTPILIVDAIEPVLDHWEQRVGLERTASVPHGDRLAFVILAGPGVELMLQTRASLAADLPGVASRRPSSLLYAEVASLNEAMAALTGVTTLDGPRSTAYGAKEIFVVDAAGQITGFAEMVGHG